jgi:alcohol dehydrogenase
MLSVHIADSHVSLRRAPRPLPKPGYALIRLLVGGICNTDIELLRGYYGFAGRPGHEFVGVVEAPADSKWLGKTVVGEINLGCGKCERCAAGLERHCARRTVLGIVKHPGAFAEYLTLPERNLYAVPRGVPIEHAVFTEPIAAACEILDQVKIAQGAEVAVLGDGKLGLLCAQVLQAHGASVQLYGRHAEKLRIAAGTGCATSLGERGLPARAYDTVVEATGSAAGFASAIRMTRPRGTIVAKSTVHGNVEVDMARVIVDEITVVGSRCGRFAPALQLLRSGKLRLDGMISAEYPLSEAEAAFAKAQERGVIKVLLRP